jgi:ubiquinone/menaquinone biosynthesis C-methylase UbiE
VGFYERTVLPRIVDRVCAVEAITRARATVAGSLTGSVVEIGFGSGLNLPHLPAGVTKLFAVDPSTTARDLAARRIAASPVPIEFVGLDGQRIPLPNASVDAALTTFTVCTIPDAGLALQELRRVLRPGGQLHFLEHGRSPDADVARWQRRLTPLQRRIAGGCHLDRPIDLLVMAAGFEVVELRTDYLMAPRAFGFVYEGVAERS